MRPSPQKETGFTLIELMIVVGLSSFMLLGIIQVFLANSQNFRFSTAFTRMQDNGRLALEEMSKDIRMAGYTGCAIRRQIAINNVANNNPPDISTSQHLLGFDNGTGFNPPGAPIRDSFAQALTICDAAFGNNATCRVSDVLQIIQSSPTIGVTTVSMASTSDDITVSSADITSYFPGIAVNGTPPLQEDLMLITDCQRADLFRLTSVTGTTLTPNANLQHSYSADSFVTPIIGSTYFLATDSKDRNNDGAIDPIATLYRLGIVDQNSTPNAVPIARGVESLQFLYGEDTQGDEFADIYRASAADVTDFNRVVSIRIGLLIKSETDFLTDSPVAVNFLGDNFNTGAGADRRLRLQFFTTVGLRNRVP